MSLSDSVAQLSGYMNNKIADLNKSIQASEVRDKWQSDGMLKNQLKAQLSDSVLSTLGTNPIINATTDAVNQQVTTLAQGLVSSVIKKADLSPIQNATTQFFTMWANVSSFGVEVAMVLARNTASNIVKAIKEKDAIATKLDAEILALYNTCAILLSGQPFYNQYLKNLLKAYVLIGDADKKFKTVSSTLQNKSIYSALVFKDGLSKLQQAQNLLIPPDSAKSVSTVRSLDDFTTVLANTQNAQAVYAAATAISSMTSRIAALTVEYEAAALKVNNLITTFKGCLTGYISSYQASSGINKATVDHINAGTSQLDNLLADMNAILTQNTMDPTDFTYKAKLTSYGLKWGVQVAAIVEWMKANPAAGAVLLNQTTSSVTAYKKALAALDGIKPVKFTGGQYDATGGIENSVPNLSSPMSTLLLYANTIVVTHQSKADFSKRCQAMRSYTATSKSVDTRIVAALGPFIGTQTTLTGQVSETLGQLTAFANKNGLDRAAGLLISGDVSGLLALTPLDATYSAAAVSGLTNILSVMYANPATTAQQVSQIEALRTKVGRQQAADEAYANRQAKSSQGDAVAIQKAQVDEDKNVVKTAVLAAEQFDSAVSADTVTQSTKLLAPQVTPNSLPDPADLIALA